jgi:hypothetical protein
LNASLGEKFVRHQSQLMAGHSVTRLSSTVQGSTNRRIEGQARLQIKRDPLQKTHTHKECGFFLLPPELPISNPRQMLADMQAWEDLHVWGQSS